MKYNAKLNKIEELRRSVIKAIKEKELIDND